MSTNFQNGNEWISQAEAARIRGVSRQAIARLIKKGRLQGFRIAGEVLLKRAEIEFFVPEQPGRPANERIAETIKKLIESSSEEDLKTLRSHLLKLSPHPLEVEWSIDADAILSAIRRSSDLTKRGVRGIIAEAVFINETAPSVAQSGWNLVDFPQLALAWN